MESLQILSKVVLDCYRALNMNQTVYNNTYYIGYILHFWVSFHELYSHLQMSACSEVKFTGLKIKKTESSLEVYLYITKLFLYISKKKKLVFDRVLN